ncbi:MAG: patatin-like phospholipase family protein [Pseudomonadota bacterium]
MSQATMRWRALLVCLVGLTSLASTAAHACRAPEGGGPTVALVLSGGGALANTQIGAMAVIEELNIPIHCVVGTSMGAVVAGLYAAGYDVGEIREIFRTAPWPDLFANVQSRRDTPFIAKERRDQFFSEYIAGIKSEGLALPGGVVGMGSMQQYFRELTRHVPLTSDFDELRVPVRTVATNLSTGQAYVFERGDLVEAMLASMAVPAVFTPRFIEGEVYVDGGLAQNLPVETALLMGADMVIGIDLTIEPPKMDRSVSLADINLQLNRITVWNNYLKQLELLSELDVVIKPDFEGLSVSSFAPEDADDGYVRGREAAEQYREALLKIRELAATPTEKTLSRTAPEGVLAEVQIRNATKISDDALRGRLDFEPEDLEQPAGLRRKLRDLASFGGFGEVDLSLDGLTPVVRTVERPLGTTLIQAGARGATDLDGDSNFALLARISRRPFGPKGGEFAVSGEFGTNLGVTAELYRPVGAEGRYFFLPSISYRAEEIFFDVGDLRLGEFWQQSGNARLRVGRELGLWGVLSFDALINEGRVRPQVTVAPDLFPTEGFSNAGVGARFAVDTLDSATFPRQGIALNISAEQLVDLRDDDVNAKYRFSVSQAVPFGRNVLNFRARAESIDAEGNDVIEILSLGGFRRLGAFSPNSIPSTEYALMGISYYRRLDAPDKVGTLPLYFGADLEFANVSFDTFAQDAEENFGALSVYIGADTFVGPAFLGIGFSDEGRYNFFLNLGRNFR